MDGGRDALAGSAGASSSRVRIGGIGFHAALKLARQGRGGNTRLPRPAEAGEIAHDRLHTEAPSTHTELAILDLASLGTSVREFAAQELKKNSAAACADQQRRRDGSAQATADEGWV